MEDFLERRSVARVPDEEVERLKREVPLEALVSASGVELKKAGADLVGRCPFHDDREPSLVVSPGKNLWHCLGACNAGGSVIDWVMRTQGVSFRHAVELLREGKAAGQLSGPAPARSTVRRLPSPVGHDAGDAEALAQVVEYYHSSLLSSPEALAYLRSRRIDDPEAVEVFRLGFANRTLSYRLPIRQRKEGAEARGRLQRLGILRESGHEHFNGCVVVPICDSAGNVVEVYGRKLDWDPRTGQAAHLYLPGPHRGVWNEGGLAGGEVIVCESLIDALSFWCAGYRNVTAAYGTAGFGDEHRSAFSRHKVAKAFIAYDHDDAGGTAAEKLAAELMATGVECLRVVFPWGADANDVAMGANDPRRELGRYLAEARWLGGAPATMPDVQQKAFGGFGAGAGEQSVPLPFSVAEPPPVPAVVTAHDELVVETDGRRWRVRHIPKGPTPGSLRVNLMVGAGERFHVDTVDLYVARQRGAFAEAAATELRCKPEQLREELGRVLLAVEDAQAAAAAPVEAGLEPMSAQEREAALELLCSPGLLDKVTDAFGALGVVGERDGALAAWLTLVSRLSDRPLGAVVQSSSAAGKSTLADAALSLVPPEAKVAYSAMTGQALYYLGHADLAHKALYIAEEEGASRAAYPLKLLVSEGRLSIAAAGKDPATGKLVTNTYEVSGPVALLMTTTSAELDDELANRLLVLAVDEGRAQTRAVQAAQRKAETLDGLVARATRAEVVALHANAQRLLAPVAVVNPHAPGLSFSDKATRARRDNAKYLGLVRAVALAHQHQRERKQVMVGGKAVTYIEAAPSDMAAVEAVCATVLGTTADEMSPATRRLLGALGDFVAGRSEPSFTRRELRDATGLGDSQLKVHLARLVDLEYLSVARAGPATAYELCLGPDRPVPEAYRPVPEGDRPGTGRPVRAHRPVTGRFAEEDQKPSTDREETSSSVDRPVLRALRGTGAGHGGEVDVGTGR
jgi:DNA primase catalytic core